MTTPQRLIMTSITAGLLHGVSPAFATGTLTTLYTFTAGADGAAPNGPTLDNDGNIYGTTQFGNGGYGACINFQTGACGTIFKLTSSGQFTTLESFSGPNGAYPVGPLTLIGSTLYGSTRNGGSYGDGEIFSINTDGTNFKVLYQFSGKDGANPVGALLPDPAGLYGVTVNAGPLGAGELFKLNKGGTLVVLHAFKGRYSWVPDNLVYGPGGVIIGATQQGGDGCPGRYGCGTLFSYDPKPQIFSLLYQFTGLKDGKLPTVSAVDAAGNVYGATQLGASSNQGTMFELAPSGNGTYTLNTLLAFGSTGIGTYGASGPIPLPTGQLVDQSNMSLFLYDPKIPTDIAILQTIPNADFSSSPTLGPDGTLYGATYGSGPYRSGQIYTYTRPGEP